MERYVFQTTMSSQEARAVAEKKGSLLWRVLFPRMQVKELKLHYVEYRLFNLRAVRRENSKKAYS